MHLLLCACEASYSPYKGMFANTTMNYFMGDSYVSAILSCSSDWLPPQCDMDRL